MKLLMVEWVDSHSRTGWRTSDILKEIRPATCVSVGIATEVSEHITLHQSKSNLGDVADVLCIPRVAILRVRQLKTYST